MYESCVWEMNHAVVRQYLQPATHCMHASTLQVPEEEDMEGVVLAVRP